MKQTKYEWVYLYAAVEPKTGFSSALLAPHVNTGTFNEFLKILSREVEPRDHVVLIMDQAGWHVSKGVRMPANITALLLPPYSPELNPIERLFGYGRSHHLSNRTYAGYDDLLRAGREMHRALTPSIIRSVCCCDYLHRPRGGQT